MSRLIKFVAFLLAGSAALAEFALADLGECAARLVNETKARQERAEKLCRRAEKSQQNLTAFSSCVSMIHNKTQLAPEIVSDFCVRRSDSEYRECVVQRYNSDSNDNALKSCMGKKSAEQKASARSRYRQKGTQRKVAGSSKHSRRGHPVAARSQRSAVGPVEASESSLGPSLINKAINH